MDEADEMLRLQGLKDQSIKIQKSFLLFSLCDPWLTALLRKLPEKCQICLFSATYDNDVKEFANTIVHDPKVKVFALPFKF